MSIKLKRDDGYYYAGGTAFLDVPSKERADMLYEYARIRFADFGKSLMKKKKVDTLAMWYYRGLLINKIIARFKITNSERKYFWLMLNEVSGDSVPDRAKRFHAQSDFRTASILAKYPLVELEKHGPWGLWREILSSSRTAEDERVAEWITGQALKRKLFRHKDVRPLLKFARNRLKKIDTLVLSKRELFRKLNEYNHQASV